MIVAALSIARPLAEELVACPFRGRVLGRFERACNLVDAAGRVMTLALPEVGNGPFSIVVASHPGLFDRFCEGQVAVATSRQLCIRADQIDLNAAKIWEPQIASSTQAPYLSSAISGILTTYTDWPRPLGISSIVINRLGELAAHLNRVIVESEEGFERGEKIAKVVGQLAGLGSGLTPAGDDYLLGVMAALRLTGRQEILPGIAQVAALHTTTLSAAFLKAAARGEFIEPWHALAQALSAGEVEAFRQAIKRVAQFGASSGQDALAGFATTLLSLANPEAAAR